MKRDRIVIVVILGLAVAATVFAGWFRWSQGHLAQEFWGADVAQKIRFSEKVELVWLDTQSFAPPRATAAVGKVLGNKFDPNSPNTLMVNGVPWLIKDRVDITAARGLVHARQSLIQDATFDWSDTTWGPDSSWTHAVIFSNESDGTNVTILFDLTDGAGFVREFDTNERIPLTIPQGFRTFFEELETSNVN